MEEKFDLYILELPKVEPSFAEWQMNLLGIPDESRLILTLAISKSEACAKMKEINALGGYARLIPITHRNPQVGLGDARNFALKCLLEINKERKTDSKLSQTVEARAFWWHFRVYSDVDEITEGAPTIDISFLDGHKLTAKEWGEWMRLSNC